MDVVQMKYFLTVAQEGSYARAAEKLYISPQGLNKAIHKLENELQVTLFEPTGTGVALTAYGRALMAHGQAYVLEHQRILNEIECLRSKADMTLGIGIKAGFSDGLGADFLLNFILEYPQIRVNLRSFPIPGLKEAMKTPERAVWVLPGHYDTTLFKSIYEHRERLFLLVGETHPLAARQAVSVKELSGYPLVSLPHDIGQQHMVDKALEECLMDMPEYLLDISDQNFTMRLIQSGRAVSFNSGWDYKRYEGLRRVDFTDLHVTIKANVLVRQDAVETTALQCFRAYVRDYAQKWEADWNG